MYQYFFATEFVDMFSQTNGDVLLQSTLVWIGFRKLTSISTYRAKKRISRETQRSSSIIKKELTECVLNLRNNRGRIMSRWMK